jgi:hypothetical protein
VTILTYQTRGQNERPNRICKADHETLNLQQEMPINLKEKNLFVVYNNLYKNEQEMNEQCVEVQGMYNMRRYQGMCNVRR